MQTHQATGAYSTGFQALTGVGDGLVQYSTGFQAMENVGRVEQYLALDFNSSLKANSETFKLVTSTPEAPMPNYFCRSHRNRWYLFKRKGAFTSAANTDAIAYTAAR